MPICGGRRVAAVESMKASTLGRAVMQVLLLTMVLVGFTSSEAWPFTSFHLFSRTRGRFVDEWVAVTVDTFGVEARLRFLDLPLEFHNSELRLKRFGEFTIHQRNSICDEWIAAMPRRTLISPPSERTQFLRIYQIRRDVASNESTVRALRYECGAHAP